MARAAVIPQSPPKRATRGRAKGTTTTKTATKAAPKTTKSKTVSSTAETRRRNLRTAVSTTNVPVDSASEEETEDEIGVIDNKTKDKGPGSRGKASSGSTLGTLGRSRRTAVADQGSDSGSEEDELAQSDAPKKRAGRPRSKAKDEESAKSEVAPKTRGRPKGATAKSTNTATDMLVKENTRKNTFVVDSEDLSSSLQGPKQVFITTNSATVRSNMLRGPVKKKKKVTFQDVSDSEEEDMSEPTAATGPGRKKQTTTSKEQNGLGGKPVRKVSTPGARGRKPAASKKEGVKPLSPKKATQVAKAISSYASSDDEDDDLSTDKQKINLVVHSPHRSGSETTGLSSPVRRINFTPSKFLKTVDENGEPNLAPPKTFDFSESLFMSSPARRPPSSPFNYTLRETPKRGSLSLREDAKPLSQPNFTPTQNSPLKASPKKGNLETPRRGNLFLPDEGNALSQSKTNPQENSPLKSSARRGIFASSISSQPHLPQSSTPFKSSLLQSPAKKVASPFKSSRSLRKFSEIEESEMDADDTMNAGIDAGTKNSPFTKDDLNEGMESEMEERETDEESMDEQETTFPLKLDPRQQVEGSSLEDEESSNESVQDLVSEDMGDNEPQIVEEVIDDYEEVREQTNNLISEAYNFANNTVHNEQDADDDMEQTDEDVAESDIRAAGARLEHDIEGDEAEHGPSDDITTKEAYLATYTEHQYSDEITEVNQERDEVEGQDSQEDSEFQQPQHSQPEFRDTFVNGFQDVFTDAPSVPRGTITEGEALVMDDITGVPKPDGSKDLVHSPSEVIDDDEKMSEGADFDNELTITVEMTPSPVMNVQPILPYEIEEPEDMAYAYFFLRNVSKMSPVRVIESKDEELMMDTEEIPSYPDIFAEVEDNAPHNLNHPLPDTLPDMEDETPAVLVDDRQSKPAFDKGPRFTLLAEQLSHWKASSPVQAEPRRLRRRGVFSLAGKPSEADTTTQECTPGTPKNGSAQQSQSPRENPLELGYLEIHEDQDEEESIGVDVVESERASRLPMSEIPSEADSTVPETLEGGVTGHTSGTENAPHSTHESSEEEKENELSLTPVTPIKQRGLPTQTFHTVSKVPLKSEGQISPLKMSRKRGRSLSATSPVRSSPRLHKRFASSKGQDVPTLSPRKSPRLQQPAAQQVPIKDMEIELRSKQQAQHSKPPSRSTSPSKTPRKSRKSVPAPPQCLRGAVVFVDVHTTEGEDASGIFVELLQQMGARCIKSWSWNPRSSLSPVDGVDPKESRVGITHVVFKDGGVRTLEKVRYAAGLVKCVGVGWVLDCERENKWLDEVQYAVDSSIIPRGGAKRRKSMEPRALSNVNGTLVKTDLGASSSGRRSGAVENFMRTTPPVACDLSSTPEGSRKFEFGHTEGDQNYSQTPKTPSSSAYAFNMDSIGMSPATPFYLSQRSRLVQQTCPPKQTRQGLFSSKTGSPSEPSQRLKARLEASRRKSLAFKPAIGSPLVE